MKIIFILILSLLSLNLSADCLSCWELYQVEILLENGNSINGYITWNDSWINDIEIRKKSLDEKVKYQLKNANWYKLVFYHETIILGNHLPLSIIVSSNKIDTLQINDFKKIIEIPTKGKKPNGAGWILHLDNASLELIKKEPINYVKTESVVAESYFLNYNPEISYEELQEIANDRYFWVNRKSYEKEQVIGLMLSWD
jgi:hypothetical protein